MVDMTTAGRVQGPGLDLTPHLSPAPVVNAITVAPRNTQGAGSNLLQIADSLQSLGAPLSQFGQMVNQNKIDEQMKTADLHVARIQAGFGTQATAADIADVTSALHPKVRQRVTEDYMFSVGNDWVKGQLENMPFDTVMSPEAEQGFYDNLRREALKAAGNDPLKAAGFMKAVQAEINNRSQQTSAQRTAAWGKVQSDAFGNSLMLEADAVAGSAVLPQLSTAISDVAAKYPQYPWLAAYLNRSAQIESAGGRKLSNGSMLGPFQFSPTTGAQYGLNDDASRMDFALSTDGAARLAIDGYNALKGKLGREPTPGEIYLYHQQGAGGGPALLSNPDASALEVLTGIYGNEATAKKAILGNGGSLDMTAGQFANKWTSKFGEVAYDPSNPTLPAEALALRQTFFGKDEEYKLTGSLANAERRDIAAQAFMQKAIEYRDERFLMAMPEELMTPEIRDQYSKVREQIGNMKVTDIRDAEFMRDLKEKQTVRDVTFEVINRRAAGEQVNPYQLAIGPDGKIDPIRMQAAQAAVASGGAFISDVESKRQAASFKDKMKDAFLKGDFSAIPMLSFNGNAPTADDLRTAIMMNPMMNDQEKIALYNAVEADLGVVSFLQSPQVEKWYDTSLSSTIEGMARDPILSIQLSQFPDIRDRVRDAFELSLMAQVEANGGLPVDMRGMLKEATSDAREVLNNLIGSSPSASTAPSATPRANAGHFEEKDGKKVWVPAN